MSISERGRRFITTDNIQSAHGSSIMYFNGHLRYLTGDIVFCGLSGLLLMTANSPIFPSNVALCNASYLLCLEYQLGYISTVLHVTVIQNSVILE